MQNVIGILSIFAGFMMVGAQAFAGAAITYHGRILDSNDNPVEALNVAFKIQVRSPGTPNCLLYEETRTVNMTGSGGVFVIPIGDGSGARTAHDPHITIENVFSNNTALNHTPLDCNSGTAYQPGALDSRRLVVSFNDGSGAGDQDLPAMDVNYVPFALHTEEASSALKIGTVPAAQVMSVASGAATPLSAPQFAELFNVVGGTSALYVKPSAVPTCASGEVLKGTGGAFVCVTDVQGGDTLAGISCPNGKILKMVSGSWACADESGVGTENDPTVQLFAKATVGTGLVVGSGDHLAADFGTVAGKVAQGNDSRFTDARAPNGGATGDLNGSYPNPTVKGIRGNAVAATSPLDGHIYKWNSTSSQWEPGFVGAADLKKSNGTAQLPATCAANESLSWSSVSDVFTCVGINSLDGSKITSGTVAYARLPVGTAANTVAAGDDSRFSDSRAPNGSAGGELGGTYPNPTVAKLAGKALSVSGLATGQVLKYDGTNWVNAAVSSAETDPSVAGYAKNAPGTGLIVNGSTQIVPDFGTTVGKIAQGNDSRFSDSRAPNGSAGGELSGTYPNPTVAKLASVALNVTSLTSGDFLKYNGTNWVNAQQSTIATDLSSLATTGLVQRTGSATYSTLGVSAPITNSGTNIGLAVGSGLTLNSGSLVPDFGTASGKVAQGNDSRFPSSTCASGNYNRWTGSAWSCDADTSTDSTKVLKSGDTMTGALTLPSNGLIVGTDQLVANSGSVGIGTASPTSKLHVSSSDWIYSMVQNTGTANDAGYLMKNTSGYYGMLTAGGRWSLFDYTASATRVLVDSTGNVGIGVGSPTAKLHVGGTAGSDGIRFPDGTLQTTAYTGVAAGGESIVALTDGATINVDASTGRTFSVTIAASRTIANPTNLTAGAIYRFLVKQDATGNRILTWSSAFKMPGGVEPPDQYTVQTAIPGATGTPIGNMTSYGGLAAAFDGNTNQGQTSGAYNSSAGQGTIGKDWGSGVTKRIVRAKVYGSNDYGLQNPANGGVTVYIEGSSDNSSWTQLYSSGAVTDIASIVVDTGTSLIATTAYRYHRARVVSNGGDGDDRVAELVLYESSSNSGKTTVYQFISDGTNLFLISKMDTM